MAAAKYQWVEKLGHVQPLLESPVNKVAFAGLNDVRTQLIYACATLWRTG